MHRPEAAVPDQRGDQQRHRHWSNSNWLTNEEDESFNGYGTPCGPGYSSKDVVFGTASGTKSGVTITGGSAGALATIIQDDLDKTSPSTNQTFGLRASSESTTPCDWNYSTNSCAGSGTAFLQWRQFMNSSASIELQFTWFNPTLSSTRQPTRASASSNLPPGTNPSPTVRRPT